MKKSKNWQKCVNKKCKYYDKDGMYLNRCNFYCQDREDDCRDAILKNVAKRDTARIAGEGI